MELHDRSVAVSIVQAAMVAVDARLRVRQALESWPWRDESPVYIAAVGKAAIAMAEGALDAVAPSHLIAIVKAGFSTDLPLGKVLAAAHPVPDETSLTAGTAMLQFVDSLPPGANLWFLISGGASALMESLRPGVALADLRRLTTDLIARETPIQEINRQRAALSLIKGGGLANRRHNVNVRVLALSDIAGDDGRGVGSGPMNRPEVPHRVIGASSDLQQAAESAARARGLPVVHHPWIGGNAAESGRDFARQLLTHPRPVAMIAGGEPVVDLTGLDPNARGGRCHEFALAAAIELFGQSGVIAAVASDADDGSSHAAGAIIDGRTVVDVPGAQLALARHDSAGYLASVGVSISGTPGRSNVNDLYLGIR